MDVRSHIAMVFHLDKCIGCHTCSLACKNIWTDRRGAEYMWWNNVETKPGTGYPTAWEDQEKYRGGWQLRGDKLELRSTSKSQIITNIFHNPHMPSMDDYYEPWTYNYDHLFNAPEGDDQPVARPHSMVTGQPIELESGPNWDDDLGGSPAYARQDPNLDSLTEEQRLQLFSVQQLVMFYFPRICNHCINPSCVASCPSGALYKRGEDGIVLVDQQRCRAWRSCIAACPYKKVFYNWFTGKSEKCILCFPRIETGQAPACFHSCVGRIRYLGVLLYDAERIEATAKLPQEQLIDAQRELILDPFDRDVIAAAQRQGVPDSVLDAAQGSPVYQYVKAWGLALPPHIEFRTLPMLFYVPPLSPVLAQPGVRPLEHDTDGLFHDIDRARVPLAFLANLLGAGQESKVRYALRKQMAVRIWRRHRTVGDVERTAAEAALREADCTPAQAEAIYALTALASFRERFVIPPSQREQAIGMLTDPRLRQREVGFGFLAGPERGA